MIISSRPLDVFIYPSIQAAVMESKLWEIMKDRQPWRGAVQRVRLDLASEQQSLHKGSATSIVIGLLGFQCLLKPILVIFIF